MSLCSSNRYGGPCLGGGKVLFHSLHLSPLTLQDFLLDAVCRNSRHLLSSAFRRKANGEEVPDGSRWHLNWKHQENRITNAAQIIQLQYKISSNSPPLPSSFHYDKSHKSFNVAKRMISVSQDWFVIWMGFLSYIISWTKLQHPNSIAVIPPSPHPFWYDSYTCVIFSNIQIHGSMACPHRLFVHLISKLHMQEWYFNGAFETRLIHQLIISSRTTCRCILCGQVQRSRLSRSTII